MASKLCFTFGKQNVLFRHKYRIYGLGLFGAKKIHLSAANRAIVKSKWHEPIPDDMSVYDFVTKSIGGNPEKIALVSLHTSLYV